MRTKNKYYQPIDVTKTTNTTQEGVAHVGDLKYSIDYKAPEGTPIMAAFDGTIISVKQDSDQGGDDSLYENDGNYIEILHANNEISHYEHFIFKSAKVKTGDVVKTGQIIALVGNTGWSESPHLHFMVYLEREKNKTMEIEFIQ